MKGTTEPTPLPEAKSAVNAFTEYLRAEILGGQLKAGERLRESTLAVSFGFARHTVRAALVKLENESLVDSLPNKGWHVRALHKADLDDIQEARFAIESHAAAILADTQAPLPAAISDALEALLGTTDEESLSTMLDRDLLLHRSIVDAAGSPRLSSMYATLLLEIRLGRVQEPALHEGLHLDTGKAEWKRSHEQLVRSIESGDASLATAALRQHRLDRPTE